MNPSEVISSVSPGSVDKLIAILDRITGGQSSKFVGRAMAAVADGLLSMVGLDKAIQGLAEDNHWSPSEDDLDQLRAEYNKIRDELQKMSPPELAELHSLYGKNPGGSAYWSEVSNNARIRSENAKRVSDYNTAVSDKEAAMNDVQDRYDEAAKRVGEWAMPVTKILKDAGGI